MVIFDRKPDARLRKQMCGSGIKSQLLLLCIVLSLNQLHGQSVVKLNIAQPPKLTVELPVRINTADATPVHLGDSIVITGGTPPYRYSWKSGNQIISENASLEVIPGNVPYRYIIKIIDSMECIATGEVSVVVGIEENDILPVKVYPVPATSYIIIDPDEGLENANLTLYSISGVRLISTTINGKTTLPLDVKSGLYILEIKYNNRISTRKIIVSGK